MDNKAYTITSLIVSPAGIIIGLLGIGVAFISSIAVPPEFDNYRNLISSAIGLLFIASAFYSLYRNANKHRDNKSEHENSPRHRPL